MKTQHRKMGAAAAVLLVFVAGALLLLLRLSRPDQTQTSIVLTCTEENQNGWTFYTEDGPAQPVFGFGGYLDGVPASGPVAAERIMEDPGERNFLQFSCFDTGIQVFLDEKLLYTDFPGAENRADAFLENADPTGISYDGLRILLPADCAGKTLRIVTYSLSGDGYRYPVLPSLTGRFSDAVTEAAQIVWPMAAVTAQLLLALFLLLIFLFSVHEGHCLWRLLPLGGYFLLAAISVACRSSLAFIAGLPVETGLLAWLSRIYLDLLFCFLAMELSGRKRCFLLTGILLHLLLSAVLSFSALPLPDLLSGSWPGFLLFLLALALMLFSQKRQLRRTGFGICCVAGALFLLWGITRFTGVGGLYPLTNPVTSLLYARQPRAFYTMLSILVGLLCVVQVMAEFIHSVLLRQRQTLALENRSQMTQEKYEQAQETIRQTAALRHEWKNHITALHLLEQKQDLDGMKTYLDHLDAQLARLSPKIYCANLTVNTILSRIADQAKASGVSFHANALLPEKLDIAEEDLCSFLFNMLDNALEAAEKVGGEITCALHVRQSYLTIRCENTYSGVIRTDAAGQILTTKNHPASHGLGLVKMRAIAEKYGSVLNISYDEKCFAVMTALKLEN